MMYVRQRGSKPWTTVMVASLRFGRDADDADLVITSNRRVVYKSQRGELRGRTKKDIFRRADQVISIMKSDLKHQLRFDGGPIIRRWSQNGRWHTGSPGKWY